MVDRCTEPYSSRWSRYGGRGIRVCDAWLDYAAFSRDMGPRPEGHILTRRDLSGDYTPANCHWLPCAEARRLGRITTRLTYNGETLPLDEWSQRTGQPVGRIRKRVSTLGWPIGQALGLEPRSV